MGFTLMPMTPPLPYDGDTSPSRSAMGRHECYVRYKSQ